MGNRVIELGDARDVTTPRHKAFRELQSGDVFSLLRSHANLIDPDEGWPCVYMKAYNRTSRGVGISLRSGSVCSIDPWREVIVLDSVTIVKDEGSHD